MNDDICTVGRTSAVSYSTSEPIGAAWDRPQFARPTWWNANPTSPSRMGDQADQAPVDYPASPVADTAAVSASAASRGHEHVIARDRDDDSSGDVSPHFDGRAQPGDVIGLE